MFAAFGGKQNYVGFWILLGKSLFSQVFKPISALEIYAEKKQSKML